MLSWKLKRIQFYHCHKSSWIDCWLNVASFQCSIHRYSPESWIVACVISDGGGLVRELSFLISFLENWNERNSIIVINRVTLDCCWLLAVLNVLFAGNLPNPRLLLVRYPTVVVLWGRLSFLMLVSWKLKQMRFYHCHNSSWASYLIEHALFQQISWFAASLNSVPVFLWRNCILCCCARFEW